VLGWTPEEWQGRCFEEFVHPDDLPLMEQCQRLVAAGESKVANLRVRHRTGAYHWVQVSAGPFRGGTDHGDGIVASFRIIDEQVEAQRLLTEQATFDHLTGALKRGALLRLLSDLADDQRAPRRESALLFVDIDEFKQVNDHWGHAVGDLLLQSVVERVSAVIRTDDVIGRLGGDEFLIILAGVRELDEAMRVAEKIRRTCAEPVATPAGAVAASLSIGAVLWDGDETGEAAIIRADLAMYAAKRDGGDRVVTADGG
jgi:diguanylate cyclase (GGDEF)-like protein/PAS domain S-box-containing protein